MGAARPPGPPRADRRWPHPTCCPGIGRPAERLAPDDAGPLLDTIFAQENTAWFFDLDLKAGVLPGLLLLRPTDPTLLAFTERVLGNRCQDPRVWCALRAVELARPPQAAAWIQPHV